MFVKSNGLELDAFKGVIQFGRPTKQKREE